uniref:Uncharacterized protein n=1 Tax=Cacopsylla melanoneura TaxID=428564 RepID=A0A8D8QSZ6_9HEMI
MLLPVPSHHPPCGIDFPVAETLAAPPGCPQYATGRTTLGLLHGAPEDSTDLRRGERHSLVWSAGTFGSCSHQRCFQSISTRSDTKNLSASSLSFHPNWFSRPSLF